MASNREKLDSTYYWRGFQGKTYREPAKNLRGIPKEEIEKIARDAYIRGVNEALTDSEKELNRKNIAKIKNELNRKNPVPKGKTASLTQAKRRYKSFRDQPVTGTVEIKAPDYMKGAAVVGYCKAIDYTTFRGEANIREKYRHEFHHLAAPIIMKSASGDYWSDGGLFRFTYRGFLDQPKMNDTKAGIPPFPTALVVGYLDAIYIKRGHREKMISFIGKKVLLCVSESGYNFFTVSEP